jgi:uncharacterized delta-60 repeat protein
MQQASRSFRVLLAASVAALLQVIVPGTAFATPGDLDGTFDGDGKATLTILQGSIGRGVAVQADGKIVVAGSAFNGSNQDFAVARFDSSGVPDPTFDGDGKAVAFYIMFNDYLFDVAVQSNGKIVAAGSSGSDIALVRFKENGMLDPTFSGDGKVKTDLGATESARSLAIQPNGKILVTGFTGSGNTQNFAVARYNPDGTLDTRFSRDGIVTTDFGGTDEAYSVAIQADGGIVVGGGTGLGGCCDKFALARYTVGGILDPTFDMDGRLTADLGPNIDQVDSLALQADQKIVAGGVTSNGTNLDFVVTRYESGGTPDATFSGDGKQTVDFGAHDTIFGIALQSDGKIVAVGDSGIPTTFHWAVARIKAGGALDKTFSGDGKLTTSFGSNFETAFDVAVQSNGRIVAAGRSGQQFAVTRYLAA